MIDYWEAIGRLATYKDLNDKFQNRRASQVAPKVISVPRNKATEDVLGLAIDGSDYQLVQDIISPSLTEQLLSLFSAGELFRTFEPAEGRQAMQNLIGLISQLTPELSNPSTSYFIALGLIIVDGGFRAVLMKPGTDAATLLPRLSASERQVITTLVNTGKFNENTEKLGKIWDHGCDVALQYWPGYLQPIAVNAPSKTDGQAMAAA